MQTLIGTSRGTRERTGPAVIAASAFAAGIAIGAWLGFPLFAGIVSAAVLIPAVLFLKPSASRSFVTAALMTAAGMTAVSFEQRIDRPFPFNVTMIGKTVTITGTLAQFNGTRYGNTYLTVDCTYLCGAEGVSMPEHGLVSCVLYDMTLPVTEGSRLTIEGTVERRRLPLNKEPLINIAGISANPYRITVSRSSGSMSIDEPGMRFFRILERRLARAADSYSFYGYSPLIKAMTIGDSGAVDSETRETFAQAGIAHLLAVSGLHIGIIAAAVHFMLGLFPIGIRKRRIFVITAVFLYAGICGFRPPVTRAALMLLAVYGAALMERRNDSENALFASLLVILAITPSALFGASLQLSFAAVWSIVTFHGPVYGFLTNIIRSRSNRVVRFFTSLFAVSLTAWIGTAAISLCHFGTVSPYSTAVNLLAVPLSFPIVIGGFAAIAAGSIGGPLVPVASVLSLFSGACVRLLIYIAHLVSKLPAFPAADTFPPIAAALFMAWLYVVSRARASDILKKTAVYLPLVSLVVWAWHPVAKKEFREGASGYMVFFDVGQGDAALVSVENGPRFLVDTGPRFGDYDTGKAVIAPGLGNLGICRIDGVFVSHGHSDHIGGLESILDAVQVGGIYCPADIADSLSGRFGIPVTALAAGDSIAFSNGGIFVLAPPDSETHPFDETGDNDSSLVMRVDMGKARVLFTGDIEGQVQSLLTVWGSRLDADMLKVPHHGAGGLRTDFLSRISPETAVISCGEGNRYGHPNAGTLDELKSYGSHVFRTDRAGSIVVEMPSMRIATQ